MPERVLQGVDHVFAQEGEFRVVGMIEGEAVGLPREQPAQDASAQVEGDEGLGSQHVEGAAQQGALARFGDVGERGTGDEARVPLQPANQRVAVAEFQPGGVFQAAAAIVQTKVLLAFRAVKEPDAGNHRRAGDPVHDLGEKVLQTVEVLRGFDEMLKAERIPRRPRTARAARAVLLQRARPGELVPEHLRLLHPADALDDQFGEIAQRLPIRFHVHHPIDTGFHSRLKRGAARVPQGHGHHVRVQPADAR